MAAVPSETLSLHWGRWYFDVPSLHTQQACAIPPLLELCTPSHRNNDMVTSGASSIPSIVVTIVISAVLYVQKIRLLKKVVSSLTRGLGNTQSQGWYCFQLIFHGNRKSPGSQRVQLVSEQIFCRRIYDGRVYHGPWRSGPLVREPSFPQRDLYMAMMASWPHA